MLDNKFTRKEPDDSLSLRPHEIEQVHSYIRALPQLVRKRFITALLATGVLAAAVDHVHSANPYASGNHETTSEHPLSSETETILFVLIVAGLGGIRIAEIIQENADRERIAKKRAQTQAYFKSSASKFTGPLEEPKKE